MLQLEIDDGFPLPYNNRIARRLLNYGFVFEASNDSLRMIWQLFIDMSMALLKALINVESEIPGTALPHMETRSFSKKDLINAAKKANFHCTYEVWDEECSPVDAFKHTKEAFKKRWTSCSLQQKKAMNSEDSDSEHSCHKARDLFGFGDESDDEW